MDHVLAQLLHERVFGNLRQLEALASTPDAHRLIAVEAHRLIAAWRTLLTLHEPTESGSCKACGPRWRKHMCSVWRVATTYFIRDDGNGSDARNDSGHRSDNDSARWSDA